MDRISRRRFIEDSLLVSAVAAVPGAILADPTVTAAHRGRRLGPNDRIRIACIGVNGRGMEHVNAFSRMDDVDLVAICDADTATFAKAVAAVEKNGKKTPATVQDIRRIVEDKNIDAVSIATGNYWHALAAIWAMQNGKDVYVEKPVSHNVSEGRRMVEVARKTNKICQTGTQSRSSDGLKEAMAYLHEGNLGKITLSRALCYKRRPSIGKVDGPQEPPPTVDYDLWCGPAEKLPVMRKRFHYDWHWQWNTGNGDLGNQGIHEMDKARWGLNKQVFPQTVLGLGGRFGYEDDGNTPNTELVFMDYGDCKLIFEVRGLETPDLKGAKVGNLYYGEKGYMVVPSYEHAIAYDNDGNKLKEFKGKESHFRNFIDVVHSRNVSELNADIEQGHLSSALCHLGNISYKLGTLQPFNSKQSRFGGDKDAEETYGRFEEHLGANGIDLKTGSYTLGRKLTIDQEHERFRGSKEANQLLTRDYRKGFEVPGRV